MVTRKARRHSGRKQPQSTIKEKRKYIINECLEPQIIYDEWVNYRDGYRNITDKTKIINIKHKRIRYYNEDLVKRNKRIKRLERRRVLQKWKKLLTQDINKY